MLSRLSVTVLATGLAISSVIAFNLYAQSTAQRREIRIGLPGLPETVEPGTALEGAGPLVARQVFDTLVAYREASTDIEPSLATRWSASRDGLVWTFALRDNVRFHDGKALTAAEVVAGLERPLKVGTRPTATVWAALLRDTGRRAQDHTDRAPSAVRAASDRAGASRLRDRTRRGRY
jgi:ABC-type transport system substrate-binding protein